MKKFVLLLAGLATACAASADWGSTLEDPVKLFPTGTSSYSTDVRPAPDGSLWSLIFYPNVTEAQDEMDIDNVVYEYRLQYYDQNGNAQFPELGLLVSNYENKSYTTVNDLLYVDSDGNAIVAVLDHRNSSSDYESFTAYKISPEGEFLWGEEGVPLSDPLKPMAMGAWMKIIELEDHSFVFAWMDCFVDGGNGSHIQMQRLSNDGKPQWDLAKSSITDELSGYPFLVNSGDNTFILVYGRTASSILYARKLDFDCESVWGKDTRIYRGGWGTIPLQVILSVRSSGDGGALIAWTDDRSGTQVEWPYISYVTADGELGFAGQSDESDVKLSYEEGWRAFQVDVCPATDGSCFYAVWRRTNPNQNMQGVMGQKISKTGELLWGDNGLAIEPVKNTVYGYVSLQPTTDGACAFYEEYRSYYDQQCMAIRFDSEGMPVWENEVALLSEENRQSSDLYSQTMSRPGEWLLNWSDGGSGVEGDKDETYMMTRFNEDGTFGLPTNGVESLAAESAKAMFDGEALRANVADGTAVSVYTIDGVLAAECEFIGGAAAINLPCGLYIAEIQGDAVKFVIK